MLGRTLLSGLIVILFVCLSVDALSANGRNVCKHRRVERYTAREKYNTKCGFWWRRCTRYRQVSRTRTATDLRCCSGWASGDNVHCSNAICFGNTPRKCPNGGTCVSPGNCNCKSGFSRPRCNDINECQSSNGECGHLCHNSPGSYSCSCRGGFGLKADGKSCGPLCYGAPIGVCKNDGICLRPAECACPVGYASPRCDDINECNDNNGGCSQTCTNTPGSFRCSCEAGYGLVGGFECKPVCDTTLPAGKCKNNGTCIEPNVCECGSGFAAPSCDDINECLASKVGCEDTCENIVGSFRCKCSAGFRLASDQRACEDVDECKEGTSGCSNFCVNTPGSFHCDCPLGYALGANGKTCQDVNECSNNNGSCSQTCTNTDGSYQCSCQDGFALDSDRKSCRVEFDDFAPKNFRIVKSLKFGPVATFILNWDPPTKAEQMTNPAVYVLEISNLTNNPPKPQRVFFASFGLLLQAMDGETTVRVRAVLETGLSPYAELVIPAVGEGNPSGSNSIFVPALV